MDSCPVSMKNIPPPTATGTARRWQWDVLQRTWVMIAACFTRWNFSTWVSAVSWCASSNAKCLELIRLSPFLWSRVDIITSHAAGPGSIHSGVFPQPWHKCQEICVTFVPGYHMAIIWVRVVHSETKALCSIRNFIIIFILTTLWYDVIMKLLKHKRCSVEAWLVYNEGKMVFDEQNLLQVFQFSTFIIYFWYYLKNN